MLDPVEPEQPARWPDRWWARLAVAVRELAPVLLLGTAVVLLGGGWLA